MGARNGYLRQRACKKERLRLDRKRLKERYPHLFKEIKSRRNYVSIMSVRSNLSGQESVDSRNFAGYDPDVVDFIRRCDTEEQAVEIIEYLRRRGELTDEYAEKLLDQLRREGVRSFGAKKERDYYLKMGGCG